MTGKEMMALLAHMPEYELEREIIRISPSGETIEMAAPRIITGEQLSYALRNLSQSDLKCEIVAFTPGAAWRIDSLEMDERIVDRMNLALVSVDGGPAGKPLDTERDDLNEVIADIAYLAGERKYYSGDSRDDIALFVDLAQKFQAEHKDTEWDNHDYIDTITKYAAQHLACCEHGTPKDELGRADCEECRVQFGE